MFRPGVRSPSQGQLPATQDEDPAAAPLCLGRAPPPIPALCLCWRPTAQAPREPAQGQLPAALAAFAALRGLESSTSSKTAALSPALGRPFLEAHRQGPAPEAPAAQLLLETWPATLARALTGNRTGDPLVCRPALGPPSGASRGGPPCDCPRHLRTCECSPSPASPPTPGWAECVVSPAAPCHRLSGGHVASDSGGPRSPSPTVAKPQLLRSQDSPSGGSLRPGLKCRETSLAWMGQTGTNLRARGSSGHGRRPPTTCPPQ
ncbi:translation initiation factor IF-2-like [Artibeus jamaicensis]|uniref:translation initiation factor IF-2-like n=1 Tax=Artibeus jamaicensis TaxID=9417 RepID=UPI00235A57B0|nr:translation initiation factor IF-2-like [Artibeus jamaicensis]